MSLLDPNGRPIPGRYTPFLNVENVVLKANEMDSGLPGAAIRFTVQDEDGAQTSIIYPIESAKIVGQHILALVEEWEGKEKPN